MLHIYVCNGIAGIHIYDTILIDELTSWFDHSDSRRCDSLCSYSPTVERHKLNQPSDTSNGIQGRGYTLRDIRGSGRATASWPDGLIVGYRRALAGLMSRTGKGVARPAPVSPPFQLII